MNCFDIPKIAGPCKMPRNTPVNYEIELDAIKDRKDHTCEITFRVTFRLPKEGGLRMLEMIHPISFTKMVKIFAERILKY